ncbi:MAG: hypothetical protein K0Q55_200 [Verrucomicrobia bacterium]|jgi:hypothetical protein|nr:hypothetical protein [Verrucomicrobiota bacterium]
MKLPFILASDMSGMLEMIILWHSFWVLLVPSVIAFLLTFEPTFKRVARGFTIFSLVVLGLQFAVLLSYLKSVPKYRWAEELGWNWRLIITVVITLVAAIRTRKSKASPTPEKLS